MVKAHFDVMIKMPKNLQNFLEGLERKCAARRSESILVQGNPSTSAHQWCNRHKTVFLRSVTQTVH